MNLEQMTQQFLKRGGKIHRVPGFTGPAPRAKARHPEPKKRRKKPVRLRRKAPEIIPKPGAELVGIMYISRATELSHQSLTGRQLPYAALMPTLRGRGPSGSFQFCREEADAAIERIKAARPEARPAVIQAGGLVGIDYISEATGLGATSLRNAERRYRELLPEPAIRAAGNKPAQYRKDEADRAIIQILAVKIEIQGW